MTRRDARIKAMELIYMNNLLGNSNTYDLGDSFANTLVRNVVNNKEYIDSIANKYLINWTIDRLSTVDRAILELAIAEYLYSDLASKIIINEAVEIAKRYSDKKVVAMINATLDKAFKNERR